MPGKPLGSNVGLYMDTGRVIEPGDYIQTRSGRTYLVDTARQQTRGSHTGRWHLRCIVVAAEDVVADATVHPLWWYSR